MLEDAHFFSRLGENTYVDPLFKQYMLFARHMYAEETPDTWEITADNLPGTDDITVIHDKKVETLATHDDKHASDVCSTKVVLATVKIRWALCKSKHEHLMQVSSQKAMRFETEQNLQFQDYLDLIGGKVCIYVATKEASYAEDKWNFRVTPTPPTPIGFEELVYEPYNDMQYTLKLYGPSIAIERVNESNHREPSVITQVRIGNSEHANSCTVYNKRYPAPGLQMIMKAYLANCLDCNTRRGAENISEPSLMQNTLDALAMMRTLASK
eukprot:1143380-Ditylum_brightwellii.AAC.1